MLCLGSVFALRIIVRSYLDERSDFVRNPPTEASRHPERAGIAGLREITFSTPDGSPLAAWYAPPRNGAAIVLVHGTSTDRSGVLAETRFLSQAGFGVLALDLPGQGASGGQTFWGVPERQAISAALSWLAAREEVDPRRIGAFGHSMGGYVLAQAAALDKRMRAVVLAAAPNDVVEQNWLATTQWGPLTQWPTYWALRASGMPLDMMPKDIVGEIAPRALFILGGDLDREVPVFMTRQLYAAAGNPKELWVIPGAHHNDYLQVAPREYPERVIDFYRRSLLAP